MAHRTTFFLAEIVGPFPSFRDADAALQAGDPAEYARLAKLADGRTVSGHRAGSWRAESLEKMAARAGVSLTGAYSVPHDGKGFINSARREIV